MTDYCERCRRSIENHATARVNGVRVFICPQSEGFAVSAEKCEWVSSGEAWGWSDE